MIDKASPEWALGERAQGAWEGWLARHLWSFERLSHIDDGRGAPMTDGAKTIVVPDLSAYRNGRRVRVECKGKTHPTWWRNGKRLQEGIDADNLDDYLSVMRESGDDILIAFWEKNDVLAPDFPQHVHRLLTPGLLVCGWLGELEWRRPGAAAAHAYGGKEIAYTDWESLRSPERVIGIRPVRQMDLMI